VVFEFSYRYHLSLNPESNNNNTITINFTLLIFQHVTRKLTIYYLVFIKINFFIIKLDSRYFYQTMDAVDALLSQSVLKPGFQKNYKVPVNEKSLKIIKRNKKVYKLFIEYGRIVPFILFHKMLV